jgi:hypothetical protein
MHSDAEHKDIPIGLHQSELKTQQQQAGGASLEDALDGLIRCVTAGGCGPAGELGVHLERGPPGVPG